MPIVNCPKCKKRYDPGDIEEDLPENMSLKVVCPACGQWVRLPSGEPVAAPKAPPDILKAMKSQSRLVEDAGSGLLVSCPGCKSNLRLKADPGPGKKIKCPKCANVFAPSESGSPSGAKPRPAGIATAPKSAAKAKPAPPPELEEIPEDLEELEEVEELEEAPPAKKRPSRERDDDDELDEEDVVRPRKKKRRKKSGNSAAVVALI